ncbi:MAG: phosphoribosylformylglycinamidine synthase subunit PurS [Candidatus Sumerlaeaceae bacterium]|nr:phosphoribosylformylglycinamidine synthase subunit PurS [Candidatus Sumerlaeaceae bacterium]
MIRAHITVSLKEDVMDPQGKAVHEALASLGHGTVKRVRVGRYFDVTLDESDVEAARAKLRDMCEALLANTVIERYEIRLESLAQARTAPITEGGMA